MSHMDIEHIKYQIESLLLDKRFVLCQAERDISLSGNWMQDYPTELSNIDNEILNLCTHLIEAKKMNKCDCKHSEYCRLDVSKCTHIDDPWCKPDGKILSRDSSEINRMQGRKGKLK